MKGRKFSILTLGCAGVLSGLLTAYPPLSKQFLAETGLDTSIGAIFGIVLAIYFGVFRTSRSIWKLIALPLISTAAWIFAMFSAFFVQVAINNFKAGAGHNVSSLTMFAGGFVGALTISATVLPLHRNGSGILGKGILISSLGGGFLGVVGDLLGYLFKPQPASWHGNSPSEVPLLVIWQAGMGCLLAAFLTNPESNGTSEPWPEVSILHSAPVGRPRSVSKVPLWAKILVLLVVGFTACFVARGLWSSYRLGQEREEFLRHLGARPSLLNTQPIEPMTGEEAVILHPIAGRTVQLIGPWKDQPRHDRPEAVNFAACYMHLPNERCEANPPEVDVHVSQWPSSTWSNYILQGIPYERGLGGGFTHPKKIQKFGKTIMADVSHEIPGKGTFYWTCGSVLLVVNSRISDPDEFIREYLKRYPSSL